MTMIKRGPTPPLKQRLPITVEINLEGLGYDEGSHGVAVINPTQEWLDAWNQPIAPLSEERDEAGNVTRAAETVKAYNDRVNATLFPIVPFVVRKVVLSAGDEQETFALETSEQVAELWELDPRVIPLIIEEAIERGRARVVSSQRDFRLSRAQRPSSAGALRNAGSDVVADSVATD